MLNTLFSGVILWNFLFLLQISLDNGSTYFRARVNICLDKSVEVIDRYLGILCSNIAELLAIRSPKHDLMKP